MGLFGGKLNIEKLKAKKDVKGLIEALGNSDVNIRGGAANSLGEIGDVGAIEPLIQTLKDEHWTVRALAAVALGKIGDASVVEPLIQALTDENLSVRDAAVKALKKEKVKKSIKDTARVEAMIKATDFFEKGAEHGKRQEWSQAISALEEAVRLRPDFAKAHQILAIAYAGGMKIDSAKKQYEILKQLDEKLARELANNPLWTLIEKTGGIIQT